jgi:hypothetical protein
MRGHEDLISLRKRGVKPAGMVWICDYQVRDVYADWMANRMDPEILVDGDDIESLDLRFLIGMNVNVTGDDSARVRKLASRARKAGANTVVAFSKKNAAIWQKGDEKWQTF